MVRTAGSWRFLGVLGAVVTLQTWGCDEPTPPTTAQLDVTTILADLQANVIVPRIQAFRTSAATLQGVADDWAANPTDTARKDVVKAAWSDTMRLMQELEPMQVGPTAASLTAVGGMDFADELYSWPETNPCRIDQETVEAQWGSGTFFDDNLVNTYGLDAAEYLLWAGPDNTCPGQIPINAEGSWDALGPDGIEANRAAYVAAITARLVVDADALEAAWGDHALDAATYGSDTEALNAVYDALFYLETHIQDLKLAEPLGRRNCTSDCVELVESFELSNGSNVWLHHNVIGVRDLYTGMEGAGFDDVLLLAGHDELSRSFTASLDEVEDAITDLQGPVNAELVDRPAAVDEMFEKVQAAADLLRGDIATALTLQIPNEAAGDND